MKRITNYVSPEVDLLSLANEGILCASEQFDSEQNETITEKEYIW